MKGRIVLVIGLFALFSSPSVSFAAWPGVCNVTVHYTTSTASGNYYVSNFSVNSSTGVVTRTNGSLVSGSYYTIVVSTYYKDYKTQTSWTLQGTASGYVGSPSSAPGTDIGNSSNYNTNLSALSCSPCQNLIGQSNYNIQQYPPGSTYNPELGCYENCQVSQTVLWTDCITDQCVASVKYDYTGQDCSGEPGVSDLQPTPPPDCQDEIAQKIAQCGGSLNVQTFDYNTCSGQCTPDSCQDQWAALLQRCGGIVGVASWNSSTCNGTCASDPVPSSPEDDEKPPTNIEKSEKINDDGSKDVTNTYTYYNSQNNTTYTETTVTHYDSNGNQTGQSSSSTKSSAQQNPDYPSSIAASGTANLPEGNEYNTEVEQPEEFNFVEKVHNFIDSGLPLLSSIKSSSLTASGSPSMSTSIWGHQIEVDFSSQATPLRAAGVVLTFISLLLAYMIIVRS